jgi:hypothetical protein
LDPVEWHCREITFIAGQRQIIQQIIQEMLTGSDVFDVKDQFVMLLLFS